MLIAFRNYGTSIYKLWKYLYLYILTLRRLRRYHTVSLLLSYKSVNYFNLVILFMNLARSIVAFLLIPFCVLVHFVLATKFEVYESRPLWAIVVISASLIVLLRLLVKSKTYKKPIFLINIISWVFVIGIIWWSQILTSYKPFNKSDLVFSKAELGENKLITDSGNEILVSTLISNKPFTLFVFYRGHW